MVPLLLVLVAGLGAGAALLWGVRLSREAGTPAAVSLQDGQRIFEAHCAVCHGPSGRGDGPGAEVIRQKMTDFTDPVAMRRVNDRFLFEIIQKGGSQFGRSNAMPAWGMKLSDEQIRALVAYIRSLSSEHPPASSSRKGTP
ncbi:MAG TPA: cytochrome c [Candidatus Methylomirabilis sp.]|nr:cytochrome c [Candidatus Methylomirabilis sp.]